MNSMKSTIIILGLTLGVTMGSVQQNYAHPNHNVNNMQQMQARQSHGFGFNAGVGANDGVAGFSGGLNLINPFNHEFIGPVAGGLGFLFVAMLATKIIVPILKKLLESTATTTTTSTNSTTTDPQATDSGSSTTRVQRMIDLTREVYDAVQKLQAQHQE